MLQRLERLARAAARALAVAGLAGLLGFAVTTRADGLMRWLASSPIDAVRDLGGVVIAVAVTCCFPLAFLERANIGIHFVSTFVGPRASRVCDAVAALAAAVVMALVAWEMWAYAGKTAAGGDTTFMLGVRLAPFWYAVDAILWLVAAVQLLVLALEIERCRAAFGGSA